MYKSFLIFTALTFTGLCTAQTYVPLDTTNLEIQARAHVIENFQGKNAIYLQGGFIRLKNREFLNGTIEYDIYLKEEPAFPGVYFRLNGSDAEHFYIRPHQSGNPDANQAIPMTLGITPWQLYHAPKYSFPYKYRFDAWTHVKIVVQGDRAQVFLDYAEKPQLSWKLFHEPKAGQIRFTGGNASALHLANIKVNPKAYEIVDFNPVEREPLNGLISKWEISEKFEEKLLDNPKDFRGVIASKKWLGSLPVEEGTAVNISRMVERYNDDPGNTVLARVVINSNSDQQKFFEFGFSDRALMLLNGQAIYRGQKNFRSRDYRYLGTVGLFDGVFLNLKKGRNELVMAISEDFGGWLVTGRFQNMNGLRIED